MARLETWPEVESKVEFPAAWLALLIGAIFSFIAPAFAAIICLKSPPSRVNELVCFGVGGISALMGGMLLLIVGRRKLFPSVIAHAARDVLADVSVEPVITEGAFVHGRVTHELVEADDCWEFRPAKSLERGDKRFLVGFWIAFLVLGTVGAYWFHGDFHPVIAAMMAALAVFICGGIPVAIFLVTYRMAYRNLSTLKIPKDGQPLTLDQATITNPGNSRWRDPSNWMALPEAERQTASIPPQRVIAVQLCPWKFVFGDSQSQTTTWAVQGLLVSTSSALPGEDHERIPLLLTSDFEGAARLMHRLADVLRVPFLFSADSSGWKAESLRAQTRPPLSSGGCVT